MVDNISMLFFWLILFSYLRTSTSQDSLALGQSIRDGETLVSAGGTFELGFFSPGNSTRRYLGMWYRNITPLTVVWVANRGTPLHNILGVFEINEKGVLLLLDATNSTVWLSNISSKSVNNPIAQLLDSGNLVVKNEQDTNEDHFLWQSFDYPCDTWLPGMKLGWNLVTGLDRYLSSWKSEEDPAEGEYTIKVYHRGYPQVVALKGSVIKVRGSWNGLGFTGVTAPQQQIYQYEFVLNEKEVYFEYQLLSRSIFSIFAMNPSGVGQRFVWTSQTRNRELISTVVEDKCQNYGLCGVNSICSMGGSYMVCDCLKGFVPKFPEQWNISYWSNGCVRRTSLDCSHKDGFWRYTGMKLPDTSSSWFSKTMNLEECQHLCQKNCSCTSYSNLDIGNEGSGCLLWFDDLIDMRQYPQGGVGQVLYLRVPASELDQLAGNGYGNKKKKLVGIIIGVIIFVLTICVCVMIIKKPGVARKLYRRLNKNKLRKEEIDLPTFNLPIIAKATANFSSDNKLGEGGFGSVYKGTLIDGQEIAVKRLSKKSAQGLEEFKNEVVLIAKLQHRNLVKLLGCCVQGEENILIYEYMPNKSLDYFIFDGTRRKILDWVKRFNIIRGIGRGLLYLHRDSRLRIIHRDLKTSNILLDANLDPKISDFGLARIFLDDQDVVNTNRVVGTYGYIPPEYAVHGHFSVKSDVFSFGVMVLEIVGGKKNREFSDLEHHLNLLGHAWTLWSAERPLELLDEVLKERCNPAEVIRCIQVGLLCVQQKPEDRPGMSAVVLMLNGEKLLPQPNAPAFYTQRGITLEAKSVSANCNQCSPNELSITLLEAR